MCMILFRHKIGRHRHESNHHGITHHKTKHQNEGYYDTHAEGVEISNPDHHGKVILHTN